MFLGRIEVRRSLRVTDPANGSEGPANGDLDLMGKIASSARSGGHGDRREPDRPVMSIAAGDGPLTGLTSEGLRVVGQHRRLREGASTAQGAKPPLGVVSSTTNSSKRFNAGVGITRHVPVTLRETVVQSHTPQIWAASRGGTRVDAHDSVVRPTPVPTGPPRPPEASSGRTRRDRTPHQRSENQAD